MRADRLPALARRRPCLSALAVLHKCSHALDERVAIGGDDGRLPRVDQKALSAGSHYDGGDSRRHSLEHGVATRFGLRGERENIHLRVRLGKGVAAQYPGELCAQHVLAKPSRSLPSPTMVNRTSRPSASSSDSTAWSRRTFFSGESRPTYPILTIAFGPRRRAGVKTSVLTPRDMTNVGFPVPLSRIPASS